MTEEKIRTNKTDFVEKLLGKIKKDKLEPRPRWQFLLKSYTLYIAGVLALLIGALAVAVMIYLFNFNDWHLYRQAKIGFGEFFLLTLPYFWLLFLALFVFIVYYNLKHTKRGYRYPGILLIGALIILSIILGTVFYSWGFGEKIDTILGKSAPFYGHVFNPQIDFWSQPEEGRLAGLIIRLNETGDFVLLDRELKEWSVSVDSEINHDIALALKQPLRLLGKRIGDSEFLANQILMPPRSGQGFFRGLENRPRHRRMKNFLLENNLPPITGEVKPVNLDTEPPFLPTDKGSLVPAGAPAPISMPYY